MTGSYSIIIVEIFNPQQTHCTRHIINVTNVTSAVDLIEVPCRIQWKGITPGYRETFRNNPR